MNHRSQITDHKPWKMFRVPCSVVDDQSGQAMLIFMLFFLFLSLSIILGLISPVVRQYKIAGDTYYSRQSYFTSESGVEDAMYRLNNNKQISGSETIVLGSSSATTTITTIGSNQKQIATLGSTNSHQRHVQLNLQTGSGVSFNYGVQVGQGGLQMDGSSGVNGNVFSNGPIIDISNSFISGSAVAASSGTIVTDQSNGASGTPPNTITFANGGSNNDAAQSFQIGTSASITQLEVYLKRSVDYYNDNISVRITTDSAGKPATTALATTTIYGDQIEVTPKYGWAIATFSSPVSLTVGTTYWLVLDASGGSGSNYYVWGANTAYASGQAKIGQYGGTTWNNTSPSGLDGYFKIYRGGTLGLISGVSFYNPINIGNAASDSVLAHVVSYVSSAGKIFCQSGGGNNKSCDTSQPDPSPQPMPISDTDITDWETAAAAGGTYSGNFSLSGTTTACPAACLGPKKISGNLDVSGSAQLTVTGPLWVTGNFTVSGSAGVHLASSYGSSSDAIIVDGKVNIAGSSPITGSGFSNSYILVVSNSACPTGSCGAAPTNAIDISGSAGAVILYAPNGTINFSGSASAKEATANRIVLSGSTTVNYQTGLLNPNFTSGPGGSWAINSWKEIQ